MRVIFSKIMLLAAVIVLTLTAVSPALAKVTNKEFKHQPTLNSQGSPNNDVRGGAAQFSHNGGPTAKNANSGDQGRTARCNAHLNGDPDC